MSTFVFSGLAISTASELTGSLSGELSKDVDIGAPPDLADDDDTVGGLEL